MFRKTIANYPTFRANKTNTSPCAVCGNISNNCARNVTKLGIRAQATADSPPRRLMFWQAQHPTKANASATGYC